MFYGEKKKIGLYWIIAIFAVSVVAKNINLVENTDVSSRFIVSYIAVNFILSSLVIFWDVNITFFMTSVLYTKMEKKHIGQPRAIKNCFYISYMFPMIIINIFYFAMGFFGKKICNDVEINLLSILMYTMISVSICWIIKRNLKSKKIHRVIPCMLWIGNVAFAILGIIGIF